MPSTYSPTLKLELIGAGEQVNTWGITTNTNMGTLIEQAITGVGQVTLTGDYTLTSFNGLPDDARNAVLVFGGSLSNAANITAPSVEKTYIIANNSGANIVLKTSGSNGITLANGTSQLVYCDGVDFYQAINVNSVTGDITVTGNQSVGNTFATYGNVTFNGNVVSLTNSLSFTSYTGIVDASKNTGALIPPTGTTGERPAQILGTARWNTTLGWYEIWNGITWVPITGSYTASYLIVGGGGGSYYGGGGGGGYLANSATLTSGTSYPITVGAGGSVGTGSVAPTNGGNSVFNSLTAIGGGAGANVLNANGTSGGSGGGAGAGVGTGGAGTSGQGFAGGSSPTVGFPFYTAAGGGGAGAVGNINDVSSSGSGGNGLASSITGTSTYYAGGGGGGFGGGSPAANGLGGGNTANLGGGGATTSGGSGVVIISYTAAYQRGTGGTVTSYSSGGNTYYVHTFTSSGTFIA